MKVSRFFAIAVAAVMSYSAFADAANTLISFSTVGPDKYVDGVTVLDGEWYALVWSADGVFDGFTADCKATDPNDAVIIVAPLAKGGKCPFTVFQIDSRSPNCRSDGTYSVYLLDTRSADKTAVAAAKDGRPVSVNATFARENYTAASAIAGGVESKGGVDGAWGESSVAGFKQPKITAFKINGAVVQITVSDLVPAVKYNVVMGETVDKLETYALETPAADVESANFEINADAARFFKVVREPLVKQVK